MKLLLKDVPNYVIITEFDNLKNKFYLMKTEEIEQKKVLKSVSCFIKYGLHIILYNIF